MILDRIVEQKRLQLLIEKDEIAMEDWEEKIEQRGIPPALDFLQALTQHPQISMIAEIKKASPSKGLIRPDMDAAAVAQEYLAAQVEAISVLTEKNFFLGSDENLVKVRQIAEIPLLRKDFIIDRWQIYQSRYLGADAILLIAALLTEEQLRQYRILSESLGMHCLVEVHDREELEKAVISGGKIIGVNNRDLRTFHVDLATTERLVPYIPQGCVIVSESGISSAQELKHLSEMGVNAVLMGETLMRSHSIQDTIFALRAGCDTHHSTVG